VGSAQNPACQWRFGPTPNTCTAMRHRRRRVHAGVDDTDDVALCEGELVHHWWTGEAAGGQGWEMPEGVEGCDVLERFVLPWQIRTAWERGVG
jgi:hypothetical protein